MNKLVLAGLTIFFLGLILLLASSVSVYNQSQTGSVTSPNVQGGYVGIIMIGPIPIMIGGGSPAVVQTGEIVGGILAVLMIVLYIIMWRRAYRRA